ncbi:hypothetical protein [Actinacidiphila acididurans]|uniref:PknH-like extracellular domain-containing protein n=1 Tax=Actinacidiphila acididurans TaxID=2784346 RepID=A0ABS2TK90_9ACTN|nr:hypothetical protein [Actinacidiphila acididurans]MBM9503487.1 hypothetical protein [Actinacidiphila acididurans]
MARGMRAAIGAVSASVVLAVAVSGCGGGHGAKAGERPATGAPATSGAGTSVPTTSVPVTHPAPTTTGPVPVPSATGTPLPVPVFGSAVPVLTAQQLKAATFRDGSVSVAYGMPVTDLKSPGTVKRRPVAPAACDHVMAIAEADTAPAGVSQLINWRTDIYPGGTVVGAYPPGGARQVFRALTADLALCRAVSGTDYGGAKFTNRIVVEPRPAVGAQAVRFDEVAHLPDGDVRYNEWTAVRVGDVVVSFEMTDIGRRTPFPPALVTEQVRRLADAQRSASRG